MPRPTLRFVGIALTIVLVTAFLTSYGLDRKREFWHLPIENWREAAAYVERTFGEGVSVASNPPVPFAAEIRLAYLDPGRTLLPPLMADGPLAAGEAFLYDRGGPNPPSFDFTTLAPVHAEVRFPQQRGQYLRVLSAPPLHSRVAGVNIDGAEHPLEPLVDRRATAGEAFRLDGDRPVVVGVEPTTGTSARSLVLVGDGPMPPVERVTAVPADGGSPIEVAARDVTVSGSTVSVALGDRRLERIEVTLAPSPRLGERALHQVWINPTR